jgi:hypothetical protein
MAEYLQPFGNKRTVAEKRELFSFRNRMVTTFPKEKQNSNVYVEKKKT